MSIEIHAVSRLRVKEESSFASDMTSSGTSFSGFLDVPADKAWGRPVDVQVMPDGALLVSDEHADAIYRIAYRKP